MGGWVGGLLAGGRTGGGAGKWFAPSLSLPGGVTRVSIAGAPEPSPEERSGDSEQMVEDGGPDTAAQAQPVGSKVSLLAAAPPSPDAGDSGPEVLKTPAPHDATS